MPQGPLRGHTWCADLEISGFGPRRAAVRALHFSLHLNGELEELNPKKAEQLNQEQPDLPNPSFVLINEARPSSQDTLLAQSEVLINSEVKSEIDSILLNDRLWVMVKNEAVQKQIISFGSCLQDPEELEQN